MTPELRILVVDQRQTLGEALSQYGHSTGWQVMRASTDVEAISLIASERIDLIVADMQLDGSSGLELLQRVRHLHPNTHSILLSTHPSEQEMSISVRENIQVLRKPGHWPELISLVHRCIGQSAPTPHQDSSSSHRSLFQLLRTTYGLQISQANESIDYSYVPLDLERLGLVALNGKGRGIQHQLRRRALKDRAEKLLRSEANPARALDLLQQELGDQIQLSSTHIFIGMFDKLKQTFSHAQIGFDSPELYRKRQTREISTEKVALKSNDQLCLSEVAETEDTLTEILRVTVEWGAKQGAQLTFEF